MAYEGAVLWDIDGTVLTTAKAGRLALRAAVLELCGVEIDYGDLVTSGLTDAAVHALALREAGLDPDPELVTRISAEYVRRLPEALPLRAGGPLPGIVETLTTLADRGNIVNLLLTGNTEEGARVKLAHCGLDGFFANGGAFCDGDVEREPIARRALELALGLIAGTAENVVVVGDTPRDIACATDVGLRAIGLTTGLHGADVLAKAGAWRVFDRVPAALELERLVLSPRP